MEDYFHLYVPLSSTSTFFSPDLDVLISLYIRPSDIILARNQPLIGYSIPV